MDMNFYVLTDSGAVPIQFCAPHSPEYAAFKSFSFDEGESRQITKDLLNEVRVDLAERKSNVYKSMEIEKERLDLYCQKTDGKSNEGNERILDRIDDFIEGKEYHQEVLDDCNEAFYFTNFLEGVLDVVSNGQLMFGIGSFPTDKAAGRSER